MPDLCCEEFTVTVVLVRAGATADGAATLGTCGQPPQRAGPPVGAADPRPAQNRAKVSHQPFTGCGVDTE